MKICVLGNSHAAALKARSDKAPGGGDPSLNYFVMPGRFCPDVEMIDGRMHPATPRARNIATVAGALENGLKLSDYGLVVISACGIQAARTEFLDRDSREHPLTYVACAGWAPDPAGDTATLVSSGVFHETVAAHVRSHNSLRAALLLARHFDGPVVLQPWPAPSRHVKNDPDWNLNVRFGENGPMVWLAFVRAQYRALQAITAELGPRFTLLDYPLREILEDGFMDDAWCHPKDPWHGNERYGALVLEQIAAQRR